MTASKQTQTEEFCVYYYENGNPVIVHTDSNWANNNIWGSQNFAEYSKQGKSLQTGTVKGVESLIIK